MLIDAYAGRISECCGVSQAVWLSAALPLTVGQRSRGRVNFNRDVRPILSETCFRCHGPDSAAREAELRLDNADDAFADRGEFFAIVPGRTGAK